MRACTCIIALWLLATSSGIFPLVTACMNWSGDSAIRLAKSCGVAELALAELPEVELVPAALVALWPDAAAVEAVPAGAAAFGAVPAAPAAAVVPLEAVGAVPAADPVVAGAVADAVEDVPELVCACSSFSRDAIMPAMPPPSWATETVDLPFLSSTIAVLVPLSTVVVVSDPWVVTVTCGPCPPPTEMFDAEPAYPLTTLPVASFVTRTMV